MAWNSQSSGRFIETLREIRRVKVHLLLLAQILYFLGLAVIFPHSTTVLTNYFAERYNGEAVQCTNLQEGVEPPEACKHAHDTVLAWSALKSVICSAVLGVILTPLFCRWSDYFGRKRFLILGTVLGLPAQLVFVAFFLFGLPLTWYYPATMLQGSFGFITIVYAYISDVIEPGNRTAAFGVALTPLPIALILGPSLTFMGLLASPLAATIVGIGCTLASLAVVIFLVPESLSEETRMLAKQARDSKKTKTRFDPLPVVKDYWISVQILFRTKYFFKLAICMVIVSMMLGEVEETEVQYLQEVAGFGTKDQAIFLLIAGAGALLIQSVGIWLFVVVFHMSNKKLILLGLSAFFLRVILLAACTNKVVAFLSLIAGAPAYVIFPAVAAIKASYVSAEEQGAVQGALGSAQSLAQGIGPSIFLVIYRAFRSGKLYFPGAPFVVCAFLVLIAMVLVATIKLPGLPTTLEGIEFMERRKGAGDGESARLLGEKVNESSHAEEDVVMPL